MTDIRPEHMAAAKKALCIHCRSGVPLDGYGLHQSSKFPRGYEYCEAEMDAEHEAQRDAAAAVIAEAIAAATADLTAERNDLLEANGQLTTECAGLRITTGKLRGAADAAFADLCTAAQLCGMRDDEYPLKAIQRRIAELEKRAACGTCCGFGHVHIEADGMMLNAVVDHAACGLEMHEICDDCRPCPECGGGERKPAVCGACAGSGHYDADGSPPCGACDGTGLERGQR